MKKLIALTLALLLVISLLPATALAVTGTGDGETTYRALLMYCSGSDLGKFPQYDAGHLADALGGTTNFETANITKYAAEYADSSVKSKISANCKCKLDTPW